tara:strand:- start:1 stop:144 length:144 start_codon:yes stop_codon:yes gene_type:complete
MLPIISVVHLKVNTIIIIVVHPVIIMTVVVVQVNMYAILMNQIIADV